MRKILNRFFDWLAISTGITVLILLLAYPESKYLDGLTMAGALFCAVYIIRALCLLIRRPQFDWHLFHGSFLRKVICLVLLIPCLLTSVIKCKNLLHDASVTCPEELIFEDGLYKSDKKDLKDKQTDPPLLWSVYYHFIDPGNQHMTTSKTGRGWSHSLPYLVYPLVELKQCIFYLSDRTMIRKVDILQEGHCRDFAIYSSEKSAGLFCIVAYHHKMLVGWIEKAIISDEKDLCTATHGYKWYPVAGGVECIDRTNGEECSRGMGTKPYCTGLDLWRRA